MPNEQRRTRQTRRPILGAGTHDPGDRHWTHPTGDPQKLRGDCLLEQDEIEYKFGIDYFERRDREMV